MTLSRYSLFSLSLRLSCRGPFSEENLSILILVAACIFSLDASLLVFWPLLAPRRSAPALFLALCSAVVVLYDISKGTSFEWT